jgi:hypothetical protein
MINLCLIAQNNRKQESEKAPLEKCGAERWVQSEPCRRDSLPQLQLFKALIADQLALEKVHITRVVAEDAGGMILLQDDLVAFRKDFEGILHGNIHGLAQFDGNYDSSQVVKLPYDTGRFHSVWPPKNIAICTV